MASIRIENLKSITLLDFEIPKEGVHVLTSANGSGKTTLLTCLERLANPNAFQRHFKTSSNTDFDDFRQAKISYSNNNKTIFYKYKNTNWTPYPKNGARNFIANFGFKKTVYLTASQERFYIQSQELDTSNIKAVSNFFKDGMNEIFQTDRFTNLKQVKLSGKGRGNNRRNFGFLLPTNNPGAKNTYFTERNFSLGEIIVLNALFALTSLYSKSLVLVDEVELALHPRVQIRLLDFISRISSEKKSTIIISTHSASLIKSCKNLIYLERKLSGIVEVNYNCYPAIALQNIAVQEEVQPDAVFFVEDDFAKYILESFIDYYFNKINHDRRPIIKVLPVAGWPQTINLTVNSAVYLIPKNTKLACFLDLDAKSSIDDIRKKCVLSTGEVELINTIDKNIPYIKFLPITPELGIVNLLNDKPDNHIVPMQNYFNDTFDISQIILDEISRGYNYSSNPRDIAKKKINFYIEKLSQATNKDSSQIKTMLAQYFVFCYAKNEGYFQSYFRQKVAYYIAFAHEKATLVIEWLFL